MKKIFLTNLIIFSYFFSSCVSKLEGENTLLVNSGLLNLPYQESILIYPDSTLREQRTVVSEMFIPPKINEYLSEKENDKIKNKIELDRALVAPSDPPTPMDIVALAFQDLRRGDSQKAIEKINNILNILERNRTKTLSEDLALSPYREAYLVLAMSLLHSGNDIEAISILEKLVISASNWAQVYLVLSEYYINKNSFALAKNVALRGIDLVTPSHSGLYVALARAYRGEKNYDLARQALNTGALFFPTNSEIISWFGVLDFDEKNYSQACKLFQKAYEQESSSTSLAHNYAVCLLRSGQYEQANKILRVAIANNPSNPKLYYTNGIIEEARKNYLAAQKSWQTYLSLISEEEPNYPIVLFKLSQMSVLEKEQQELPDSP